MTGKLRTIAIYTMLIATIGVALTTLFGGSVTTYLYKYVDSTTGLTYYRYDFASYFRNITFEINDITNLNIQYPTREWQTGEWGAVLNDLAVILDWIIFALNWLLFPIKLGGYIITNIMAILGISSYVYNGEIQNTNPLTLIYKLAKGMKEFVIPYV